MGKCFQDKEELSLAASLSKDIEEALDNSDWFIAICSPRYLEGEWCKREMKYFMERKEGAKNILLVLVDGHHHESIPDFLLWKVNELGERVPHTPLAADARGNTMSERIQKLQIEKYRLLARILDVGFDDLRRRSRQRRLRILATVCSITVIAITLLGFYIVNNNAKNKQLSSTATLNRIGEMLQQAQAETEAYDRQYALGTMLNALSLSNNSQDMRHDEIISDLRKMSYVEPFSPIATFHNDNMRLLDIVASPDGKTAAGIVNNNSVAVIDLTNYKILYQVSVDNSAIGYIRFSYDGSRFMAICDTGRLVTAWNTSDGSIAFSYTSKNNARYQIANAFFWQDNDTLLVQDMEHFYLVNKQEEKLFYTIGEQQDWYSKENNLFTYLFEKPLNELFTVNQDDYSGVPVVCTPDCSRILIAGRDGETGTILLDGNSNVVTPLYGMPGMFSEKYAISNDGKTIACTSIFGFVAIYDGETGELLAFNAIDNAGSISDPVFSPDNNSLGYVANNILYICDSRSGEIYIQGTMDSSNITPSLSFSDNVAYVFIRNQSLYIIDANGRLYAAFDGDSQAPYNNAIPFQDKILITKGDGSAMVYSTPESSSFVFFPYPLIPPFEEAYDSSMPPENNPFSLLQGEHELTDSFKLTTSVIDLAAKTWYASDEKHAALTYPDGVIEIFGDTQPETVHSMVSQLTGEITALAMCEERMIASDHNGRMVLYDLRDDKTIRVLNQDILYASLAINQDFFIGLRQDGMIDVYDMDSEKPLFTIRNTEPFTQMGFSRDGEYVIGVTESGAIGAHLWQDEEALLAFVQQHAR